MSRMALSTRRIARCQKSGCGHLRLVPLPGGRQFPVCLVLTPRVLLPAYANDPANACPLRVWSAGGRWRRWLGDLAWKVRRGLGMAWSFGLAVTGPRATAADAQQRLAACAECPRRVVKRRRWTWGRRRQWFCGACGCGTTNPMAELHRKVWLKRAVCPLKPSRWERK